MNVLLTSECNRRCTYCFAQERVRLGRSRIASDGDGQPASVPRWIAREDFLKVIGFIKQGPDRLVGILGGEPSLHPEFATLLEDTWGNGLSTKVFTNGLWRAEDIDWIAHRKFDGEKLLRVIVNVNHPSVTPAGEQQAQSAFLRALGSACTLSCNISRLDLEFDHLLQLILECGTDRHIRLGMAEPLAELDNEHLLPEQYGELADKIVRLSEACDEHGITVGFDCGFTFCMFDECQLGRLIRSGAQFRSLCGPAVDVGTDLSVWACFPLSALCRGVHLADFASPQALHEHFQRDLARLYRTGALPACLDCRHRTRGRCAGGCGAHVYRRYYA